MTKQRIIEAARGALDNAMDMHTVNGDDPHDPWLPFYLGKAWAYLDVALGGEKEDANA